MIDVDPHTTQTEWPLGRGGVHDPVLARDPVLAMLEEAWRSGLLVENEPNS